MTERQEKFCREFIKTGNATKAYKKAGYDTKDYGAQSVNASRLLRNDKVQERLAELRQRAENKEILSASQIRALLTNIATDKDSSKLEVMKALDILNKMNGEYIAKTQITGADGGPVSVNWEVAESGASYKADNNSI